MYELPLDEKGEGRRNADRKATVHVPQLKVWYPVLGENNNTIEIVKIEDSKD